jgi:hypothetical protein
MASSTSPAAAAAPRRRTSPPSRKSLEGVAPRRPAQTDFSLRLSGLEPFNVNEDSLFVNVGERTNVTGSKAFARLILNGQYAEAVSWRAPRSRPAPR